VLFLSIIKEERKETIDSNVVLENYWRLFVSILLKDRVAFNLASSQTQMLSDGGDVMNKAVDAVQNAVSQTSAALTEVSTQKSILRQQVEQLNHIASTINVQSNTLHSGMSRFKTT
jgi:uncharacterized phage infection (PIP) family protein YhgE